MTELDLVIQAPGGPVAQLLLLHHGVGMGPESMGRLGLRLAAAFPSARVVAVAGPHAAEAGRGRHWYPSRGISDEERVRRVQSVLGDFISVTRRWQEQSGVGPEATALVGFSQGAIMSLEAVKLVPGLAGRVLSFGGRFAELPSAALGATTVHLFHGDADRVIPSEHSSAAAECLAALGSDVTLDLSPGLGHGLDETLMARAVDRLRHYVPRRLWQEALAASRPH